MVTKYSDVSLDSFGKHNSVNTLFLSSSPSNHLPASIWESRTLALFRPILLKAFFLSSTHRVFKTWKAFKVFIGRKLCLESITSRKYLFTCFSVIKQNSGSQTNDLVRISKRNF